MVTIYKPKFLLNLILLLVNILIVCLSFIFIINIIDSNQMFMYIIIVIPYLYFILPIIINQLTRKVYVDSNEICIKTANKKTPYYGISWSDIDRVAYKYRRVYLYHQNKKIFINTEWNNHKQIWMQIHDKLHRDNKTCYFDSSFITLIERLKK